MYPSKETGAFAYREFNNLSQFKVVVYSFDGKQPRLQGLNATLQLLTVMERFSVFVTPDNPHIIPMASTPVVVRFVPSTPWTIPMFALAALVCVGLGMILQRLVGRAS
jgi:hypothetical protein